MRAITSLAMMPPGANGDSVPANAPLPAMSAISSGDMPTLPATAMAGAASRALAGVPPGPIVDTTTPSAKNMTGNSPAFPRQSRTARPVNLDSVPLVSAMLNSSVTPTSVTSNGTGKPDRTVLTDIPPRYTPTSQAMASDRMPTLIVVRTLSATARTSAPTETHASVIAPPRPWLRSGHGKAGSRRTGPPAPRPC